MEKEAVHLHLEEREKNREEKYQTSQGEEGKPPPGNKVATAIMEEPLEETADRLLEVEMEEPKEEEVVKEERHVLAVILRLVLLPARLLAS